MLNFLKKQEQNPLFEVFNDLTINQKLSIMNLLMVIATCDNEQGNPDKEMNFLNTFCKMLGVTWDGHTAYYKSAGPQRMINDLKLLNQSQKEILVSAALDMITCDGKPNETELNVTLNIFKDIGIDEVKFVATVEKSNAAMNYIFRK